MENTADIKSIQKEKRKVKLVKFFLSSEFLAILFIVILSLITYFVNENFFTWKNIFTLLRNCSFIGIMAIGQALIIMTGEMDLSVGSVSALSSVVFGLVCIWDNWPIWAGLLLAVLVAVAVGALNGFLMLKVGVMKWVATMATSSFCASVATYLTLGVPITPVPQELVTFANSAVLKGFFSTLSGGTYKRGLSVLFVIFVVLVAIAEIVLRYTKYGRMIQASGISSDSAYMAGVNVRRVKWITLMFVSVLAFIGGLLSNLRNAVILPGGLGGADFKTIAACYIGGIGFVGRSGSVLGLFLGVVLIQLIENSMTAIGWDPNVQIAIIGVLVMLVLSIDVFKRRYMASRIDLV